MSTEYEMIIQLIPGYIGQSGYSGASGLGGSGYSGYSGLSGFSGDNPGSSGYSGGSGYSGYSGAQGVPGTAGPSGYSGYSGGQGTDGVSGYSGYSGSGISGYSGAGFSGYSGYSGSDGGLYTNAEAVPVTIGGIEAGSTFSSTPMADMWTSLLYPYQVPAFTSFLISGQATVIEVGDTVPANPTFTWAVSHSTNVTPNTTEIRNVTGSSVLVTGGSNTSPYAATAPSIMNTIATTNLWSISQMDTHALVFARNFTVAWRWRIYYGESALTALTESDIKALRVSALSSGFAATYSYSTGGYKYICYPESFGTATSFVDDVTGFDVPFEAPYSVSVTNINGIVTNYRVHRTTYVLGGSLPIAIS
jgi:hypothetical protein